MTAKFKNNGGSQIDVDIGGVVVASFGGNGLVASAISAPGQLVGAIRFDGVTMAVQALFGVAATVVRIGVGQYRVNFSTNIGTAYFVNVTPRTGGYMGGADTYLTGSVLVTSTTDAGAYSDSNVMCVTIYK